MSEITNKEIQEAETEIGHSRSDTGYRIIGWASVRQKKTEPHVWYSGDLEYAKLLGTTICQGSGMDVEIAKHVCTIKRTYPVEIIES